jgi:hypothetical protein
MTKNKEKTQDEFITLLRQTSTISECDSEKFVAYDKNSTAKDGNTAYAEYSNQFVEKQEIGSVGWNVYAMYFQAAWGMLGLFVIVFLFLAAQALNVAADYWLSLWHGF